MGLYDDSEEDDELDGFEQAEFGAGNQWWMILTLSKALPAVNMAIGVQGLMKQLSEAIPGESFHPTEIADIFLQHAATGAYVNPYPYPGDEATDPITEDGITDFMKFLANAPDGDEGHTDEGDKAE